MVSKVEIDILMCRLQGAMWEKNEKKIGMLIKEAYLKRKIDGTNKKIYVCDIDNCICNTNFPNLGQKADISVLKECIAKSELFPEFVKFYETEVKNGNKFYFITGRKWSHFGQETLEQLRQIKIKKEQLICYPEEYAHTPRRYFVFKIYNSLKIIRKDNYFSQIVVFDDIIDYFSQLKIIAARLGYYANIETIEVNSNDMWSILNHRLLYSRYLVA